MKRAVISAAVLLFALSCPAWAQNKLPIQQLLVYWGGDMTSNASADAGIAIIDRAAAAGYNGIVWTDWNFVKYFDKFNPGTKATWLANAQRIRNQCALRKILCIPAVCPFGYSSSIIVGRDRNMAEGLPAKNVPMRVVGGQLVPLAPDTGGGDLANVFTSDFETMNGSVPTGWNWVDGWGTKSFQDSTVKHSGSYSLKFCNLAGGNGRICRTFNNLRPFSYYHARVWIKTENFTSAGNTKIMVLGVVNGQGLMQAKLYANGDTGGSSRIAITQDWTRYDVTFNTLDSTAINFYIGTWSGSGNSTNIIWFDDVTIEPAGFVNVLRRPNMMPTVTSVDGSTVYLEGRDYSKIGYDSPASSLDGEACWTAPQTVTALTTNPKCKLHEGDVVNVSFCHTCTVSDGQQAACMAEPTVFDIINAQIRNVHSDLAPDGYFLSHDEIRMGGWDGVCDHTGKTPGEILGDNLRRCTSIIRKEHAPGIAGVFRKPLIYTWSDMFDPFHNAKTTGRYYYCKGDGPWKNSWNGLSSNVIIMNWLSGSTGTLNWFAGNSTTNGTLSVPCKQVLAGYYDGSVSGIDSWLNTAATIKNPDLTNSVIGVMYTTWAANYTDLEAFATEVSNYATPGTWPPPKLAP